MSYFIDKAILNVEELADILDVGINTTYDLVRTKKIKAFKIGRVWKIPRDSVEEFILGRMNGEF